MEVEVRELVVVVEVWHARRGFLAAAGAGGGGDAPASCRRSRRRAAGTQVLLTWVEQSKPRLVQQVRHRLWPQSFLAWLPQSWHVVAPEPEEPAAASSIGRGFLM